MSVSALIMPPLTPERPPEPDRRRERPRLGRAVFSGALDVALILVFAGLGRSNHFEDLTILGVLETAWPFLTGLALVWGWGQVWRHPAALLRSGIPVWLGTVAIGMVLRLLSGDGTALAFIVVAVVTLGVFFLGWRLIALLAAHLLRRPSE